MNRPPKAIGSAIGYLMIAVCVAVLVALVLLAGKIAFDVFVWAWGAV